MKSNLLHLRVLHLNKVQTKQTTAHKDLEKQAQFFRYMFGFRG